MDPSPEARLLGSVLCGVLALMLVGGCGDDNAMVPTYDISGRVADADGRGISGVALSLGAFGTATTDIDGRWSGTGLSGEVEVTTEKPGWRITPPSRTVSTARDDVDFSAEWTGPAPAIAFTSDRSGAWDIWVMEPDGSNPVNLTRHDSIDFSPAWSPNGTRIAFFSSRNGARDIWVMNVDGSDPLNLTAHDSADTQPAWSRDGTKIAFLSRRRGTWDVWVMNANGTDPVNLTGDLGLCLIGNTGPPAWSPDGTKIAFQPRRACSLTNQDVMTINADGSGGLENLTDREDSHEVNPAWSPDGTRLAFSSNRTGAFEIWVLELATGAETQVTSGLGDNKISSSWRPDGTRLTFMLDEGGNFENFDIWAVDLDATNLVNLTNHPDEDWTPAWTPF